LNTVRAATAHVQMFEDAPHPGLADVDVVVAVEADGVGM
jgi:hypothetical protein